jgi:hypothetical protein
MEGIADFWLSLAAGGVGFGVTDRAGGVGQLAHGAEGITEEVDC